MMATEPASGMVLISEGLYRLLLQLYPRRFRDQVGLDMSRTFRDCCREQYQRDRVIGLMGYCLFTTLDTVKTALEERVHRGEFFMSKETLIRIGGPAMILAGMLWIIGSIDRFDSMTWMLLFPAALAIQIGLMALSAYASGSTSRATRAAAIVAVAANGLAIVGFIGATIMYRGQLWPALLGAFTVFISVLFAALLMLGVRLLREPLLPRWGGLPLLLNLPVAAYLALGAYSLIARGTWVISPAWVETGVFAIAGLAMLLLGCAMLPPKQQTAAVTQP